MLVQFSRRTEATGFDARISGRESAWVTVKRGKHTQTYSETVPIVEQALLAQDTGGPLFWPGEYEAGTYTLPFAATLPFGIPPSYSGSWFNLSGGFYYDLKARLQVSWGPDPTVQQGLLVVLPPYAPSTAPAMTAAPASFGTGGTSIELRVDTGDAPREGLITGDARVNTTGTKRLRSVKVVLTEQLHINPEGYAAAAFPKAISEHYFGPEQAAFGTPLRFQLPVPPSATPSFDGRIVHVNHAVRAEADMAFAVNPTVRTPFRVT